MKIGLVPGSFKPYHAGHDALIRLAAAQNDDVLVFSSSADRIRKGELPLYSANVQVTINKFVKPNLPRNVQMLSVSAPVSAVWCELERAEAENSEDVYTVYSDCEDIQKFSEKTLDKYIPRLLKRGQIITRGVERGTDTPFISGTAMRAYLMSGDIESFTSMLPPDIRKHGKKIASMLMA